MAHFGQESGAWKTFDAASASTEFWKSVPILTRASDGEEHRRVLTVRILSGFTSQSNNLRILRVHISSEDDPLFLHTLEVSEDDFQALKVEQGIHVDFGNFPGKFIGLLNKCIESQGEDMPRFQAVLMVSVGESKFQILETNDFNKLPHVTLKFRPGDDVIIKQFLAFHLSELKENCSRLESELKNTRREGRALQLELGQTWGIEDKRSWESCSIRSQLEREHTQVEQCLRDELVAVKGRNEKLAAENRELLAIKNEVSSKGDAHKDSVDQYQEQIETLKAAKAQLDIRAEELKQNLMKAEERVKELENERKKTDEIIEKFATDVHEAKGRTRKISAQLMIQKDIVLQLRSQLQEATSNKDQAQSECDKARMEVSQLESANRDLKDQLEQCQRQLLDNNSMVTDPQLQYSASFLGRGFRPSVHLTPSNSQMSTAQMRYPGYPTGQPHLGQSPPSQPGNPNFALRYQALRD